MNLSLKELNELVYCVGVAIRSLKSGELINLDVANELYDRLNSEIESRVKSENVEEEPTAAFM